SRPLHVHSRGAHVGLAHADAHARDGEACDDLVRRCGGERLEQRELPRVRQRSDARRHFLVVDGIVEPVGERRLGDIEIDVVQERLAELSFLVGCAVPSEDLEGVQLDGDHAPASAAATVSASTCSRTSCARMIVAPRSYAATAAAMLADSGPVVALESPRMRPSELFREKPMTTGRPSEVRTSSRRTSSKLCATVLPKPIPGSRQLRSSETPSATAKTRRSSRNAVTSDATSS